VTAIFWLSLLVIAPAQAKSQHAMVPLPSDTFECGSSEQAKKLAQLIVNDKNQARTHIHCNPTLVAIAEQKAKYMAEEGLVSHFLGGSPNSRLRDAGLTLPSYYGDAMSNQVEALAGGYQTASPTNSICSVKFLFMLNKMKLGSPSLKIIKRHM